MPPPPIAESLKFNGVKIVGGKAPIVPSLSAAGTWVGVQTTGNGGDPDIPRPYVGQSGPFGTNYLSPSPAANTRWLTSAASIVTTIPTNGQANFKFGSFFYLRGNKISAWGQGPNYGFCVRQPLAANTPTGTYFDFGAVGGKAPYDVWSVPPTLNSSMQFTYGSGLPGPYPPTRLVGDTQVYGLTCYQTTSPKTGTPNILQSAQAWGSNGQSRVKINSTGVNTYYIAGANASPPGTGTPGTTIGGPAAGDFWLFESAYISYLCGSILTGDAGGITPGTYSEGISWIRQSDSVNLMDQAQVGPFYNSGSVNFAGANQIDCGYCGTGSGSSHTNGGTTYWNGPTGGSSHYANSGSKQVMLGDTDYITVLILGQPFASSGAEFQMCWNVSEFVNATVVDGLGTIAS